MHEKLGKYTLVNPENFIHFIIEPYPCENMFQCSRTVLDFLEMFQNYANHDFQNFFP